MLKFKFVPNPLNNPFQKFEVNFGSLSDIIVLGNFSKLIYHYHDRIMLFVCSGKFGDEIHCYNFPFPLRNR
jgi:hypothetical protein